MVNAKHIEVLKYIVLLILGVPIAICLGLAVLATMLCAATLPVGDVAPIPFTAIDSMPIMAIPSSSLRGSSWAQGGFPSVCLLWPTTCLAGIALGSIGASMFFAAISAILVRPLWPPSVC